MGEPSAKGVSRRSFIKASAGAAAGAAGAAAVIVPSSGGHTVVPEPSSPAPREPVMAYVHDADRGEVTVLAGTTEATYRDPALARRLVSAASQQLQGGADVIAP